jgi:CrcB protein
LTSFLWIGAGAVLGANARYLVGLWAGGRFGVGFPYGTLLVNLTGSLILGFVIAMVSGRLSIPAEVRLFLAVGFLGSYTTFSSFSVESVMLLGGDSIWLGLVNILANNLGALACALLGVLLARAIA